MPIIHLLSALTCKYIPLIKLTLALGVLFSFQDVFLVEKLRNISFLVEGHNSHWIAVPSSDQSQVNMLVWYQLVNN